jgi:hypothetical protein
LDFKEEEEDKKRHGRNVFLQSGRRIQNDIVGEELGITDQQK